MKNKKIIFSIFLIIALLFPLMEVNAAYASEEKVKEHLNTPIKYCYYSETGAPVENNEYMVVVGINQVGEAYASTAKYGERPIANWKKNDKNWDEDQSWSAYDYYLTNGCPGVVYIHYYISGKSLYLLDSYTRIGDLRKTFSYNLAEKNEPIYNLIIDDQDTDVNLSCNYIYDKVSENTGQTHGKGTYTLSFTLSYNKNGIIINRADFNDRIKFSGELNGAYASISKNVCPNLTVCYEVGKTYGDFSEYNYRLYYGDTATETNCFRLGCSSADVGTCNPASDEASVCPVYTKYVDNLKEYYSNNQKKEYNDTKSKIISWCDTMFGNKNYDDPCMLSCNNLRQIINDLENDSDSSGDNTCTFSKRLLSWVANIVRWGKYLVPVVVIVLSILDFIKAVGADKEDEMKKAQKRFVTRLIAAALIFILPFIIEFVLTRFGFNYNGCGIIDL